LGPARLPATIVSRLHAEVVKAVQALGIAGRMPQSPSVSLRAGAPNDVRPVIRAKPLAASGA